jgi:hypothetical protein
MICEKCGEFFNKHVNINGKVRNLQRRKWCLKCSPFNKHRKGITNVTLILESPRNCKNCNKKFTKKYSRESSGFFCSKFCAHSYVGKLDKGTKIIQCFNCRKDVEVNKLTSRILCNDCRAIRIKNILTHKTCKLCGLSNCLRKDVCSKYKIIPTLIKYFGFATNTIGSILVYEEFDRIKNKLIEDYYDNKLSTIELADKYNHHDIRNFNKILDSLGIKKRSLSEAQNNSIIQGKSKHGNVYPYKSGWHETWNGKQVFYRSSYELDYCNELDEKHINYEMEKLRILYWDSQLLKQRIAIPDFYLPDTNEIIEIKSDYTYNEINMKDKLKSYKEHGYKFKLVLEHKEVTFSANIA